MCRSFPFGYGFSNQDQKQSVVDQGDKQKEEDEDLAPPVQICPEFRVFAFDIGQHRQKESGDERISRQKDVQ